MRELSKGRKWTTTYTVSTQEGVGFLPAKPIHARIAANMGVTVDQWLDEFRPFEAAKAAAKVLRDQGIPARAVSGPARINTMADEATVRAAIAAAPRG